MNSNPENLFEVKWYMINIVPTDPKINIQFVPWATKALDLEGAQLQAEDAKIKFAQNEVIDPKSFSASATLCPRQQK